MLAALQPIVSAPSSPQEIFIQQGVLGAIILALATVVIFLYKKIGDARDKLDALQEKRHDEMRLVREQFYTVTNEITRTLADIAKATDEMNEQLDDVRRAIERLEHGGRRST